MDVHNINVFVSTLIIHYVSKHAKQTKPLATVSFSMQSALGKSLNSSLPLINDVSVSKGLNSCQQIYRLFVLSSGRKTHIYSDDLAFREWNEMKSHKDKQW